MKVILEFDGSEEDFERAFDSMDDNFNINDSIFYEIDYGSSPDETRDCSIHRTEYGGIRIKVERDKNE